MIHKCSSCANSENDVDAAVYVVLVNDEHSAYEAEQHGLTKMFGLYAGYLCEDHALAMEDDGATFATYRAL